MYYNIHNVCCYCSVTHPIVSKSLHPHGLQHTSLPFPSPSPGVCPSSCLLHWWCCPAISSSDTCFSFCPRSFPASGTFPVTHLFTSDDQNTGASALASVLPVNIQDWFPLGFPLGLISLLSKGLSGVFSSTIVWRHQFFDILPSLQSRSHNHTWPLGSLVVLTIAMALTIRTFVGRVNVSAFQHTVLVCHHFPVKKQLSSDYMAAVTVCGDFGAKEEEICHYFHFFPLCLPWSNGD